MPFNKIPLQLPEDYVDKLPYTHKPSKNDYRFIFKNSMLLVYEDSLQLYSTIEIVAIRTLPFGTWNYCNLYAVEVSDETEAPKGATWVELRKLWGSLSEELCGLAGRAIQLLTWDRNHQYCGRCGTATEINSHERSRHCPSCHLISFPRVSPVVIVLIERENELLLGRSPHFPIGLYSLLAGFVEPGETLEQCIKREVAEEAGVVVDDFHYIASQSWPFPHSLMIAFKSKWISGDIVVDKTEIEDARWFKKDEIPMALPWAGMSIARVIIEDWIKNQN